MNESGVKELFEFFDKLNERNRKEFYEAMEQGDYYRASEKLGANKQISEIRQKLMEIVYENRL